MGKARILGIDIGATSVKFAAVDDAGNLSGREAVTVAAASNDEFVKQIAAIIAKEEFNDCERVGIGSPGPLDLDTGVIIQSANMPGVKNCALVQQLKEAFPQKFIRLENDANAATLGEKFFGLGKGKSDFAVMTLGTGVGGGCVFGGRLQRGYKGNFFEVGHVNVAGIFASDARLCGCGSLGCLEAYASATGIRATYANATQSQNSAAEIAALARLGDANAIEAYSIAGRALGFAAGTISQLMNITDFIFTGGVSASDDLLSSGLRSAYLKHSLRIFHERFQAVFTVGDENAGILGASALFLEDLAV